MMKVTCVICAYGRICAYGHKIFLPTFSDGRLNQQSRDYTASVSILLELGSAHEKLNVHEKLNRALQRTLGAVSHC